MTIGTLSNHQAAKLLSRLVVARNTYLKFSILGFDTARGQLQILALQRELDIGHGQITR